MLRARSLVATAVEQLGLDVEAVPRTVPFLGKAWARLRRDDGAPGPAPLGLTRFAWGGEKIAVARLELPDALLDLPLVLTAQEDRGFRLEGPGGVTLAQGAVGRPAEGTDAAGRPVGILVSALVARPGTEFVLKKHKPGDVVAALQLELAVEERGKETGVVALRLEGSDRARLAATLDSVVRAYLRQNAQRTSTRAARTLALLEARLPELKATLDRADKALESWKLEHRTVDVGAEARAHLERAVDLERRISDLEAKRTELTQQRYTGEHPAIGELTDQIGAARIQARIAEERLRRLPTVEAQAVRLLRDQAAASAMWLQVRERAQQYRIAAAGAVGSASLVDAPSAPERPVSPKTVPILGFALLVGFGVGAALAVVRGRLGGAGNAAEVEAATGLPVLGTVPHTSTEASLVRALRRRITGERAAALSAVHPGDSAVEDLRTLRTNLGAVLRASRNNVVAIGGPAPGVGKSFVCVNLALLLASSRRKVLLVDADLRRGRLHREFGLERAPGRDRGGRGVRAARDGDPPDRDGGARPARRRGAARRSDRGPREPGLPGAARGSRQAVRRRPGGHARRPRRHRPGDRRAPRGAEPARAPRRGAPPGGDRARREAPVAERRAGRGRDPERRPSGPARSLSPVRVPAGEGELMT